MPIVDGDFADPFVLRVGTSLYGYSTNTSAAKVPVFHLRIGSPTGEYVGDALQAVPAWSEPGNVWAPAVARVDDTFVLYYSTRVAGTTTQCVSSAVSRSPEGPFVDDSAEPMVCQRDLGGTIDPSVVTDAGGARWIVVKNDGNCCDLPVSLWSARLAADGRSVTGDLHRLLTATPGWEGGLIEGPSMVRDGSRFVLFYSANRWDSAAYAVGWASCDSVAGPCRRGSDDPWKRSTSFARGPGGQEFFGALGQRWMVYHGWPRGESIGAGGQRRLYVDIVHVQDGRPSSVGRGRAWTAVLAVGAAVLVLWPGAGVLLRSRRRRRQVPERRSEK